jgi:peroxiredoxin
MLFLIGNSSPTTDEGKRRGNLLAIANTLLIVTVLIAVILLFVQARNNSTLTHQRNQLMSTVNTMSGSMAGPPSVEVGDIVPSFEAVTLEGKPRSIVYNGSSDYLLYIFSSNCSVCLSQFVDWNRIASRAKLKNYTVMGLTIDSDHSKANLEKFDRDFEVCLIPSKPVQRAYRVVAVPLVMLVSREGYVKWVHYGALSTDKVKEIFSIMGLE